MNIFFNQNLNLKPSKYLVIFIFIVITPVTSISGGNGEFDIKEVSSGNFVHQGKHVSFEDPDHDDIANIGFIVGDKCIAVIDTGGSLKIGQLLLESIRKQSDLPICYVINTHVHFDHVLGNIAFINENAKFVGHSRLVEEIERNRTFFLENFKSELGPEASEKSIIGPELLIENTMEIDLGNKILLLTAYPAAHSFSDLTILDKETNTFWLGDLLFRERIPALDGSLKGWLVILENFSKIKVNLAIPGHGTVSNSWPDVINEEKQYLLSLYNQTRQAVEEGMFLDEAIENIGIKEKQHWKLHEQHHGRNVSKAFSELEWE